MLDLAFSPDGERLLSIGQGDRAVRLHDAHSGDPLAELKGHSASVLGARFSPDSALVLTASRDKSARLWNARTGQLHKVLSGHRGAVTEARFSSDGRLIATASEDGYRADLGSLDPRSRSPSWKGIMGLFCR